MNKFEERLKDILNKHTWTTLEVESSERQGKRTIRQIGIDNAIEGIKVLIKKERGDERIKRR